MGYHISILLSGRMVIDHDVSSRLDSVLFCFATLLQHLKKERSLLELPVSFRIYFF